MALKRQKKGVENAAGINVLNFSMILYQNL